MVDEEREILADETDVFEESVPWNVMEEGEESAETQRIILLYGPSGVGKTYLGAQFPKPLLLSFDPGRQGGALSARKFKPKQMKISDYNDLLSTLPILEEKAGISFKTLVCDSMSYLSRLVMRDILTKSGKEIPRFEEWNLLVERMRKLALAFTDLDCHVVFTAVDALQKNETTGDIYGGPDLPGKLAKELPQYCDVVARLSIESQMKVVSGKAVRVPTYSYTVVGDSTYIAKDRTGLMATSGPSSFESFEVLF